MTDERLGFEVVGRYEGEDELRRLANDIERIREETLRTQQAVKRARLNIRRAQLNQDLGAQTRAQIVRNNRLSALAADERLAQLDKLNRREKTRLAQQKALGDEQARNAQQGFKARQLAAREAEIQEKKNFRALENSQREIQRGIDARRREAERVAKAEERIRTTQGHITEFSRRWLFTLRRVVLVYGAIRAAQLTITGLNQALISSLTFGNELERVPKAIAGITAATFDVRDATGKLLDPVEAYKASLGEARKQLEGLKADAIGSASELGELQENFLTAIGPGSVAGFRHDDIRRFTVAISEIAAVTGQAQNQLAEEIRALFTGDIRPKDSRIARQLGIDAADIKRVREAGTQVAFLDQKFAAFKESTKDLQDTLPRVLSDLKDGARLAAAEGMEPLRLALAEIGKEIRESAISKIDGQVIIDPRLASAIKPVAEALAEFAKNLKVAAAEAANLAIQTIRLAAEFFAFFSTLAPFFAGMASVFSTFLGVLSAALKQLGLFTGSIPEWIGRLLGMAAGAKVLVLVLGTLPTVLKTVTAALILNGRILLGWTSTSIVATRAQKGLYAAILGTRRALVLLTKFLVRPLLIIGAIGLGVELLIRQFDGLREAAIRAESGLRILFDGLFGDSSDVIKTLNKINSGGLLSQTEKPFQEAFSKILDAITDGTDDAEKAIDKLLDLFSFNARIEDLLAFDDLEQGFRDSLSLQGVRLDFAAAADAGGELTEVLQIQLQLAEEEALALQEVRREMSRRHLELGKLNRNTAEGQARANVLIQELLTLSRDSRNVAALYADELARQITVLERRNRLTAEFAVIEAGVARQLIQNQNKLTSKNVFRDELSEYFDQLARLSEARVQVARIEQSIRETASASQAINEGLQAGPPRRSDTLNAEADIRERSNRLQEHELATAKEIVKFEERKLEELEKQFEARTGIDNAVKDQIRDLTAAANFGRFVTDASNRLREGLSSAVLDALDPRVLEGADLGLVAQNIGFDIARSLGQALLDQNVFRPLFKSLGGALGLDLTDPAAAAQLAVTQQLTLTTELNSLATTLNTAALHANTAAQFTSAVIETAALPVGALFVGGGVQGNAEGGKVSGPMLASAPPGLDPRDRIPAFMRKDEYVATPEMNRAAPGLYQYLEHLRRKTHGLGNVGKLPARFAMRDSFQPRGFATGGAVTAAASSSGGRGSVTVLPVLVRDSREIDRIVASPSFARGAMLHRSTLRMIQNPRPD